MYLQPVDNSTVAPSREINIRSPTLSTSVEEPLCIRRLAVADLQQLLGGPSDRCVQKTMENTTREYGDGGDRVRGVLHPRDHVRKRLTRLSARRIKGTMCTDTVFCAGTTSVDGYNCFQIFWNKLSKFLYAVPLKSEKFNYEALTTFISQVGVPDKIHFDNAKSQVSKAWIKIFRQWGMKKYSIEPHHQN